MVFREQVAGKYEGGVETEFIPPEDVGMKGITHHQDVFPAQTGMLVNDIFPGKHEDLGIGFAETDELSAGYFFNHISKPADRDAYISFGHRVSAIRIGDNGGYSTATKQVDRFIQPIIPVESLIIQ